ncbi:hypothetical protein HDU87_007564 [Geranomyces variabilis]|uniref:Uncharacterized protein n=1 Tax=Geranomyces variabilis TaxID=109894 RepID=A0AAD5XQC4_9FUNG|nr:hypothetical protein HDU87_007564 [Geranomyces variabilis]
MPTVPGGDDQAAKTANVAQPDPSSPVSEQPEINFLQNFPQWDYTVRDEPDIPLPHTVIKTLQRPPPPRQVVGHVRVPQTYQSLAKKNRADAGPGSQKKASTGWSKEGGGECKARTSSMPTAGHSSRSLAAGYEYPRQKQPLHHVRRPRFPGHDDEYGPQLVHLPPESICSYHHHRVPPQQQYTGHPPAAYGPEPTPSHAYQLPLQYQQHGRGASYPGHGWAGDAGAPLHHPAFTPYDPLSSHHGAQSVYPQHHHPHHHQQYNPEIPTHMPDAHHLMPQHHLLAIGGGGGGGGEGLSTSAYNPSARAYDQQAARAAEEPVNTRARNHHMEKLQKQKEYSLRVRTLARKVLSGETAANASSASSQASSSPCAERSRRESPSKHTQKQQHQQPRQKPPARNKAPPPDKLELALARREKMKAFVATIKKPTVFARGPSPAIVTRAELRAKAVAMETARDDDAQSDSGTELRKLEEEYQQAMKEVDGIRRALKI